MTKRFAFGVLGTFALIFCGAGQANAAEEASAAENNTWTGFYVGINAGGGIVTATATEYQGPSNAGEYSMSDALGTVGGQAGYNYKLGSSTVLGFEADFNWSSFDTERIFFGGDFVNRAKWDWFGTLRARAGLVLDETLVYVTAGAAYVGAKYEFGDLVIPGDLVKSSEIQWGAAFGAGVEFDIGWNLSTRLEYLYVGLPSKQIKEFGLIGEPGDFSSSSHMGRIGLNYKF
jgi:outer membrane immunogenic protein